MIIQLDTNLLFQTFKVSSFEELEQEIQTIAPSMVEYYLNDLSLQTTEASYINRSNIQKSIFIDQYTLFLDYWDSVYLEKKEKDDNYETESLW